MHGQAWARLEQEKTERTEGKTLFPPLPPVKNTTNYFMNIPGSAETMRTATVLVVDDIPANRDLLRATLEPQGYELLLAANGEQALKVAQRAVPDVILLDVNMPGIDGFETCRRLRKMDGT